MFTRWETFWLGAAVFGINLWPIYVICGWAACIWFGMWIAGDL